MSRRYSLGLSAITAIGLALLPGSAVSQQTPLKEQLVGAWTQVSIDATSPDGTKRQLFGPNPKGIVIYLSDGYFALVQTRADLTKLATSNRATERRRKLKPWSQDRLRISADTRSMKQARSLRSTFRAVHLQTKSAALAITSELSLRSPRTN